MTLIFALSSMALAAETASATSSGVIGLGFPPITVSIFVIAFVVSVLIDLWQHKNSEEITLANSVAWSIFWIALSLGFYGWLLVGPPDLVLGTTDENIVSRQSDLASLFLTGYVLEKVLSVDNLIVFIAIFKFFNIKDTLQHRILYFGILGAIIFRGVFVGIGSGMIEYMGAYAEIIFGLLVGYAAVEMLRAGDDDEDEEPDYENMWLVRQFQKFYPIFPRLVGKKFLVNRSEIEPIVAEDSSLSIKEGVTRWMTPAFVCLLVIEGSDVMFAFDSVPAVIAVTKEPLLVYAAMIFAILGLRSLYFVLVVLTKYMAHIETAVIYVLFFIAAKMFIGAYHHFSIEYKLPFPEWLHISPNVSMAIVLTMLSLGVIASFIWPSEDEDDDEDDGGEESAG